MHGGDDRPLPAFAYAMGLSTCLHVAVAFGAALLPSGASLKPWETWATRVTSLSAKIAVSKPPHPSASESSHVFGSSGPDTPSKKTVPDLGRAKSPVVAKASPMKLPVAEDAHAGSSNDEPVQNSLTAVVAEDTSGYFGFQSLADAERTNYVPASRMDIPATMVDLPLSVHSLISPAAEGQLNLTIRFFVSESGTVDDLEIVEGTIANIQLQELIVLLRGAVFNPGYVGGLPTKSTRVIQIFGT
jgi:hypothetical protein